MENAYNIKKDAVQVEAVSELGLNPFPWYEEMRKNDPIHFNEKLNAWELFRYNDILEVVKHPEIYSSRRSRSGDPAMAIQSGGNLLMTDPPRHRQLRSLVTQAFTPRTIAQMSGRIIEIVDSLLQKGRETGHMDLIADLAYPLPVIVISEMLGIPPEERDSFKAWSDLIVSPSYADLERGRKELRAYFQNVLQQRKQHLQDDLVSGLLQANVDGEPLQETEILDFCELLLVAGNETTTNLIGNAGLCFDEYPEAAREIREDISLLPSAIEEVLRFRSPVQRFGRTVVVDTELDGRQLKVGQRVFCWIGAANRDPAQFPDPGSFNIRRTPNRHLAFGQGIHFCLGAPLARLETKLAFERLFHTFKDIQFQRDVPLEPISSFFGYGVEHLLVQVQNA
ncbi:cytochrome P450 [Thermosporothrix hazakensis]|jgi:cytochrome P450|uniref:Cytochrome P450 n=1 Tax=Thermosporothrix hazakensis TaxID=644383 RepID=A0A326UHR5_THEHA|nr:cytochrome P450 [Thermosporothrix hazakensis]PZW31241.1 cytochrome P450 [Thermosporothrix hazakensis]GCE50848.1 putative cytochrome P450 YjiB [Thermosporothrix hazakensis]